MDESAVYTGFQSFFMPKMTYKEQLSHPLWQKKRLEIFERDNFTCRTCLDTLTQLHVHHLYYDGNFKTLPWEYENDAYTTLCKDCHLVEEYIKKENQHSIIATKKYLPKAKCLIITTVVNDIKNGITLSIFTIDAKDKLKFIINFKDTSVYGMQDLIENSKKLL